MQLLRIIVVPLVWLNALESQLIQPIWYPASDLVPKVGEKPRREHDHYGRNANAQSNCQGDDIARVETRARAGAGAGAGTAVAIATTAAGAGAGAGTAVAIATTAAGAGAGTGTAVAIATTAAGAGFLSTCICWRRAGGGCRASASVAFGRSCRYCSQRGHHCRCCAARLRTICSRLT